MANEIDEKMVEHVANAMFAADSARGAIWPERDERGDAAVSTRILYRGLARAAIDAIWTMPLEQGATILDLYRATRPKP